MSRGARPRAPSWGGAVEPAVTMDPEAVEGAKRGTRADSSPLASVGLGVPADVELLRRQGCHVEVAARSIRLA
jgi:hypothetical protein